MVVILIFSIISSICRYISYPKTFAHIHPIDFSALALECFNKLRNELSSVSKEIRIESLVTCVMNLVSLYSGMNFGSFELNKNYVRLI